MNIYLRSQSLALVAAIVITATAAVPAATAQEVYAPSSQNLKAREWFQDAKFGMFIHWGVYSVLGDGEWVMETRRRWSEATTIKVHFPARISRCSKRIYRASTQLVSTRNNR